MINQEAYNLGACASIIRDLHEYGRARAALLGEEAVCDFSLGNPSLPTPPQVDAAIREVLADTPSLAIHSYTAAAGDLATRQAIADDLNARYGTEISPQELFLGCGTSQELVSVIRALAIPGGQVLAIAPFFPEYRAYAESAGMVLTVVPPDVPGFQIRFDALEAALGPQTVAVIVNSPNNPAGTVYSRETLERLGALLTRKAREYGHPIYIISDEPYRELVYGVEPPFVPGIYPDTVICYSYSKSLSLPGERIGYIYVPHTAADGPALYAAVAGAARATGHLCAPSLLQKVLARCAHLRPDLEFYDRNRRRLYSALTEMGYEMPNPQGAFYLFVKAPGGSSRAFSDRAKALDLLVVPGDDFGCPEYFRVSYCVDADTIERSLPRFRALL